MSNEIKFDLQERLIDFAIQIIRLSEMLSKTKAANHIRVQILKSGTSSAANYGEARSAESKSDFIHKLKVALKELRETEVWLKIIIKAKLLPPKASLQVLVDETNELISIFVKSIETAKRNSKTS